MRGYSLRTATEQRESPGSELERQVKVLVHAIDAKAKHRDFQEGRIGQGDIAAAVIGTNIEFDLVYAAFHTGTFGHRVLKVAVLSAGSDCDIRRVALNPPEA